MLELYSIEDLKENEVMKLYRQDGSYVVVANHNQLGGVCDCCRKIEGDDFYRYEIIEL